MIDERELEKTESRFDPGMVEEGRQMAAWIEAVSPTWRGIRNIGEHKYVMATDMYRETETKNALFVLGDGGQWVALSEPSYPGMRTSEMTDAADEHFVQLIEDIAILEERRRITKEQEERQQEIYKLGKGCLDFVMGYETEDAKYYFATTHQRSSAS